MVGAARRNTSQNRVPRKGARFFYEGTRDDNEDCEVKIGLFRTESGNTQLRKPFRLPRHAAFDYRRANEGFAVLLFLGRGKLAHPMLMPHHVVHHLLLHGHVSVCHVLSLA